MTSPALSVCSSRSSSRLALIQLAVFVFVILFALSFLGSLVARTARASRKEEALRAMNSGAGINRLQ